MNFKLKKTKSGYYKVTPTPSDEEIENFYKNEFYSSQYSGLNDSASETIKKDLEFYNNHYQDIADLISKFSQKNLQELSLLDIGCGWGDAISYWSSKGINCSGFDPAEEAATHCAKIGLNVTVGSFEQLNAFDKKFEVVTLLNVLEHLAEPETTLKSIKDNLLVKGGILVVDVPNEFNTLQLAGQKTHQLRDWWICPPNHLNYFSPESLNKCLTYAGYNVLDTVSSFPLEIFLLFGDNYVDHPELGRKAHEKRMEFEKNFRKSLGNEALMELYRGFASNGLGRQILSVATS